MKKCAAIGLVFLFLLVPVSAYCQESKDVTFTTKSSEALQYLQEGIELLDNFRRADAGIPIEKAIKADPDFAIAYDFWAATASTTEDYVKRLVKAVELAPKASKAEQLMIYTDKAILDGNSNQALENMRELVELFPEGKRVHYYYAGFLNGRQENTEAEKEYNKVISLDPNFAPVYNDLAYLLSGMDRFQEAIKALQKYAELRPAEPNPHDSMGEIYLWMGDYDNSMKEYNSSLKLKPNFTASIAGLGHNLVFKGQFKDARAKYDEILAHAQSMGDTTTAIYWKAVSYLHEQNYEMAIATLNEELNFVKSHKDIYGECEVHSELAMIYRQKGDFNKALSETALERDLAMKPEFNPGTSQGYLRDCLIREARIWAQQGNPNQAKAKMDEYFKSIEGNDDPNLMRAYHSNAGIVAFFNKDYQTAVNELKQGSPIDQNAKYHLALSYEMTGQPEQAKKLYLEIAKYNRNSISYSFVRPEAIAKI